MITVTVRFAGPFRVLAGRDRDVLVLPEATLAGALRALGSRLPQEFAAQVLEPLLTGSAKPAMILHNREPVPPDLALRLQDGDVIAFVPPMAGG